MTNSPLRRRSLLQGLGTLVFGVAPAAGSNTNGAVFTVSVSHSPAVVKEGDQSVVTGEITNTGDEEAIQIVELEVTRNGEVTERRSTTISLKPGETESRTETIAYEEYPGPGEYVGEVCSDDDCATATWSVAESGGEDDPASFDVEILDHTSPTAGTNLEVTVAVTNTGEQDGKQDVTCTVDELGSATESVSVGAGEETTVLLSIPTDRDDAGTYTATVTSDDDTDKATVTVGSRPAFVTVDITGTTTPVAGEPLEATVAVENTGGQSTQQSITLDIAGLGRTTTTVSLAGGERRSLSLSVPTNREDTGGYTATVTSADITDTQTVTVRPRPAFVTVDITGTTTPIAGEPLETTVAVENTGGQPTEQSITLDAEGLGRATTSVRLDAGERSEVVLSVPTMVGDAGEYALSVTSSDDSTTRTGTVEQRPAFVAFERIDASSSTAGESLTVAVDVTNSGGELGERTIELSSPDLGSDTSTVELAAGESTTVTLSIPTADGDAGAHTLTIETEDDSVTRTVTVEPRPEFFTVDITDISDPVAGEQLTVTATVTNTGGVEATQSIKLNIADISDTASVTLESGTSTNVTLAVPIGAGDDGMHTVEVSSNNMSASQTVTVATTEATDQTARNQSEPASDGSGSGFGIAGTVAGLSLAIGRLLRRRDKQENE